MTSLLMSYPAISIFHRLFRYRYSNSTYVVAGSPSFSCPFARAPCRALICAFGAKTAYDWSTHLSLRCSCTCCAVIPHYQMNCHLKGFSTAQAKTENQINHFHLFTVIYTPVFTATFFNSEVNYQQDKS